MSRVDGGLRRGLDWLGHIEMRLTDTEVHGIFERFAQLEDFPDAGNLGRSRPVGQPRFGSHGKTSSYSPQRTEGSRGVEQSMNSHSPLRCIPGAYLVLHREFS